MKLWPSFFVLMPCAVYGTTFPSGQPTVMSKYGQIQNVQNYSSNPFWSPDAPHNQRMPTPVYVQGADLTAGECMSVVNSLIAAQCASRNNCLDSRISDIRPAIMLQLSRMPGHNYASSCGGYIDNAFDDYVAQYRVTTPSYGAAFPTGTVANPNINQPTYKMENPYQPRLPGAPWDPWGQEMKDRVVEMKTLQAQNGGTSDNKLAAAAFPTTIADVSFTERMENKAAGYEPYANASAYQQLNIESDEKYWAREIQRLERISQSDRARMTDAQYCDKYPLDEKYCPQTPGLEEKIIAIGNAITAAGAPTTSTTGAAPTRPASKPDTKPTQTVTSAIQSTGTATIVANNRVHGGPCTPPARSNWWQNKILTSGKYEKIDPAFEKAMITIFRKEGDCGNDPDDRGGYTCYGISSVANPDVDMKTLTRAGAEDIAYTRYYTNAGIHKLPDSIRGDVLQAGWGSGVKTGINKFRGMFNLDRNGQVDADLIAAAENYNGDLHNDFLDVLQDFYVQVSKRDNNKKFLKGWMNAVQLFRENGCHVEPAQALYR